MNNELFISIDANNIGRVLEKLILNEQHEKLTVFSRELAAKVNQIGTYIEESQGKLIMAGGDNILARISCEKLDDIICYVRETGGDMIFFAIGVGTRSYEAYMALKYSKANGNIVTKYEDGKFRIIH